MNVTKIKDYISSVRKLLDSIELCLEEPVKLEKLHEEVSKIENKIEKEIGKPANSAMMCNYAINIINNPNWPEAVPQDLIADDSSDQDQMIRAASILDQILDVNLKDKTFLDFGCGNGWVTHQSLARSPSSATGYDPFMNENWEKWPEENFTSEYDEIKDRQFDVILAYDVLDHADKPIETLLNVKKLMNENSVFYLRCHPWTSRHGTHLYKTLNKAYIHLMFDTTLLAKFGHKPEKVKKLLNPIQTYREWFIKAGFQIKREHIISEPLDNFFRDNEKIRKSMQKHWNGLIAKGETNPDEIDKILEIQFIDYTCKI